MIKFLLFAFLIAALFCFYFGIFTKTPIFNTIMKPQTFIYKNFQGDINGIKEEWEKYIELFKKRFNDNDWNYLNCMTFYYESPESCKDPKKMRYSLGLRVLAHHTELFNKIKNDGFEMVDLPQIETFFLYIPWRNFITFFFFGYFWKKIGEYFKKNDFHKVKNCVGIEVMKYFEGIIEIHMTVDSTNNSRYFLTKFPEP